MRSSTSAWSRSEQHEMPARTVGIEVGLGPGPVGGEEPVLAVGGDGDRFHADAAERGVELRERRSVELVVGQRLGEVLVGEPEEPLHRGVPRQHHDPARDALHLGDPGPPVRPVVDREDGERRVEGAGRGTGGCSATPSAAGAASGARCASITGDGSTAATTGPAVSYEPVPPPTFTIRRASPSATRICASMRGSARRVAV